jgi:HEAT repeat protein
MAIESLSYQTDKTLVLSLLPLLRDAEPEVRFWTVYTVGEIGDMSFADHIATLINDNAYVESFGTVANEARRILKKWSLEGTSDN